MHQIPRFFGVALVVGFFLPFISMGPISCSGLDLAKIGMGSNPAAEMMEDMGEESSDGPIVWQLAILVLIPLAPIPLRRNMYGITSQLSPCSESVRKELMPVGSQGSQATTHGFCSGCKKVCPTRTDIYQLGTNLGSSFWLPLGCLPHPIHTGILALL